MQQLAQHRQAAPGKAPQTTLDLDAIVAAGYLEGGMSARQVAHQSQAGAQLVATLQNAGALRKRGRPGVWTAAEDALLASLLGHKTEAEIGAQLGRTTTAVHLRAFRDLRLPRPSRAPDVITALQAAELLGIDGHKTTYWCDSGLLPSRIMAGGRHIRLICRVTFRRWVLNPANWIWFDPERIRDPELKRMAGRRMERWGDRWLTTRQVADMHGVDVGDVKRYLQDGRLRGVQAPNRGGRDNASWANWYVLASDARALTFLRGRGATHRANAGLSPAATEFLLLARAIGLPWEVIGRLMRIGTKAAAYHHKCSVARLPKHKRKAACAFVDWRTQAARFPSLARAFERLAAGDRLGARNVLLCRCVINARCAHAGMPRIPSLVMAAGALRAKWTQVQR